MTIFVVASAAFTIYALGSALDWWGGRICYRSCDASETGWYWWVVASFMAVGTGLLVLGARAAFSDRTELGRDGVVTAGSRAEDLRVGWGEIERVELVGRPGFPSRVHVVTTDGRSIRLRGLDVAVEGRRGRSVDDVRALLAAHSGRSIPVERNA